MDWNWSDKNNASRYNSVYATPEEEFLACAARLRLAPGDSLLDLGCGNGEFLAVALRAVSSVTGVDVSEEQLALAAGRLKGDPRARLVKAAFTDLDEKPGAYSKGFSRKALHHLDDSQKTSFFRKLGPAFRPGALFLLEDGIFDFERADLEANWDALMRDCAAYYGAGWESKKADVAFCFRKEYPAGIKAWTAALEAGGFRVLKRERRSSFYGSLLAEKL